MFGLKFALATTTFAKSLVYTKNTEVAQSEAFNCQAFVSEATDKTFCLIGFTNSTNVFLRRKTARGAVPKIWPRCLFVLLFQASVDRIQPEDIHEVYVIFHLSP